MNMTFQPGSFADLDASPTPQFFIGLMDSLERNDGIRSVREIAVAQLGLNCGHRVLDVGCGTGEEAGRIAEQVGPGGSVVGLDLSHDMIDVARRRTTPHETLAFQIGDAQVLPFDDASFDACRAERLLLHVANPSRALSEMARVTRSGGRIVIIDTDVDAILIDGGDRRLTREFIAAFSDATANPWIGRQLPRLLRERGLVDVSCHGRLVEIGFAPIEPFVKAHLAERSHCPSGKSDLWRQWADELTSRAGNGDLFVALAVVVASATKA